MTVDLGEHKSGDSLVYIGRERGESVRDSSSLREFDKENDSEVKIEIPEKTIIITSSFLLGMLGNAIRELGEEGARERILFDGPINYQAFEEAITEALRGDEPLVDMDA